MKSRRVFPDWTVIYVSHTDEDHISGVRELLEFVEKDLTSLSHRESDPAQMERYSGDKNYREADRAGRVSGSPGAYYESRR